MPIEMIEEFAQGTLIKVIGVGGGGGNAVEHMIRSGVQNVEFICANTDAQALNRSTARSLIQLGDTGLGAGGKPDKGKAAAEEAEGRVREMLDGAWIVAARHLQSTEPALNRDRFVDVARAARRGGLEQNERALEPTVVAMTIRDL